MRIAYLAAGAGGMYCGSCLRDNRLAATLIAQGRDVVLVPLYTPLHTDEPGVSLPRVYYGGINVFLEQKSALFRHVPAFVNRILDSPVVLRGVNRFGGGVRAESLGPLTVSVLKGEHGAQRRELAKLVDGLRELKPSLVNLATLMFVGMTREIKRILGVPVLCTLSGEDIFLDQLPQPHRAEAFELIRQRQRDVDGYIAVTDYFAHHAARHFGLPAERVHKVVMGIRAQDFSTPAAPPDEPFTIGFLARICPEKGLAQLVEAFVALRRAGRNCRLRVAGYLASADRPYYERIRETLRREVGEDAFDYLGEVTLEEKLSFLRSLHVLSVPTVYPEAKGFYVLESMASGVPVVQPDHGSFPELVEATGGGLLYDRTIPHALSNTLARLMDQPDLLRRLASQGREAVLRGFTDKVMAEQTWSLYERYIGAS